MLTCTPYVVLHGLEVTGVVEYVLTLHNFSLGKIKNKTTKTKLEQWMTKAVLTNRPVGDGLKDTRKGGERYQSVR